MSNAGPSNQGNTHPVNGDSDSEDDFVLGAAAVWVCCDDFLERPLPRPRNNSHYTGHQRLGDLLDGHELVIYNQIRMGTDCFKRLSWLLEQKNLLKSTRNMNVDEQLMIFLTIVCQSESNRETQHQWQHSGATISKYFMIVLNAIYRLRHDFIVPPDFNTIDPFIETSGSKYRPWFDNCVGALDGTHVPCVPPPDNPEVWRNRKGFMSQNVLGVCSFDMKFTYMLAGWEGSAHDARVLESALDGRHKKFPTPPEDSGYANRSCFLAPYRGSTYHLQEYRARRGRPRSERELFNYTHSSLRNCIERTFGVWKARFRILKIINNYPMKKQHDDRFMTQYFQDGIPVSEIDPENAE
ncbi:uncharacterized protein LOC112092203 [Morus notabilis]|uniref:uncharacterized protein LOC112092203 n=1 Tax=Morus notabilis TaxID=981085 RepID=UPI000CED257E|nr:uncharacterized protein LOC112092203 [Morus notabilis]